MGSIDENQMGILGESWQPPVIMKISGVSGASSQKDARFVNFE